MKTYLLYHQASHSVSVMTIADVLSVLIEAYERKQGLIDLPDPLEAIRFRMDQATRTVAA
jgi:antitoxin component HigA of HigAB toxin-antitoxin module